MRTTTMYTVNLGVGLSMMKSILVAFRKLERLLLARKIAPRAASAALPPCGSALRFDAATFAWDRDAVLSKVTLVDVVGYLPIICPKQL